MKMVDEIERECSECGGPVVETSRDTSISPPRPNGSAVSTTTIIWTCSNINCGGANTTEKKVADLLVIPRAIDGDVLSDSDFRGAMGTDTDFSSSSKIKEEVAVSIAAGIGDGVVEQEPAPKLLHFESSSEKMVKSLRDIANEIESKPDSNLQPELGMVLLAADGPSGTETSWYFIGRKMNQIEACGFVTMLLHDLTKSGLSKG